MKKLVAPILITLMVLSMCAVFTPKVCATENVIFQDDFESYAAGTFPSSRGWQLVYNGAGDQYQVVTTAFSVSGTRSLQMEGQYGWSAVVAKDFSSSSNLIGFEAYLMGTPGSEPTVGFGNETIQPWGRIYGAVWVDTIGGYIGAGSQNLQPCAANTWYKIREVVDRNAGTFDVWIDDQLKGTNIPEANNPWEIQSLRFDVGWHNVMNYYDDVKVFEISGPTPSGPVISSVSPIYATRLQTITITGSGFGNTQPQTVPAYDSDGSIDTVKSSTTPSMAIGDDGSGSNGWGAGYTDYSTVFCLIGIYLVSWSDNKIVLGGFGSALGTNGQGQWNIAPGDPLHVSVQTPNGNAIYSNIKVVPNQPNPSGPGPVISSVSPITATLSQTITITGSGFGSTWPQTVPAWDSDGSVDTVAGSTTPCVGIGNNGVPPDAWAAGIQNASEGVHCAIGLYLQSWTDTKIVLGGFGSALNTNGQGPWNIATGDPLDIAVFTTNGEAHYKITVGPNGAVGSISGEVFYLDPDGNVNPIQGAHVGSSSISTSAISDSQGNYILQNVPYGSYMIECELAGAPTRTKYAELNAANPNVNVHFCMLAQIMDNLQAAAVAALKNIDDALQTEANHIDTFASDYTLQLEETAIETYGGALLTQAGLNELTNAIMAKFLNKQIISTSTTLANLVNVYHLNGPNGICPVAFEDSFSNAKQTIEGPIDPASMFEYPTAMDSQMKAYIKDVTARFERLATDCALLPGITDHAIIALENGNYALQCLQSAGKTLEVTGVLTAITVPAVGEVVGPPVAAVGWATDAIAVSAQVGNYLIGYAGILLPLFLRHSAEELNDIGEVVDSLQYAYQEAGSRNLNPSFVIPSVQVTGGQDPSFTVKNTCSEDISAQPNCIVQLDFPDKIDVGSYLFTYAESSFSLGPGQDNGLPIEYPPSAVSWIDDVRTKITSPTTLRIELTVYADYGTKQDTFYAARYLTVIWTAQEYPVDYSEFELHSSCDLHVYDSNGRHTGLNYTTNQVECAIPQSLYYANETQQIFILDPAGAYEVELVGTGSGTYHLHITNAIAGNVTCDEWINGTISAGEKHYCLFNFSSAGNMIDLSRSVGDVNYDGKVDGKDISFAAFAFGAIPGDARWNPDCDINQDGKIDGKDIVMIAKHFGTSTLTLLSP